MRTMLVRRKAVEKKMMEILRILIHSYRSASSLGTCKKDENSYLQESSLIRFIISQYTNILPCFKLPQLSFRSIYKPSHRNQDFLRYFTPW